MVATLAAEDVPRVRRELGSHPEFTAATDGMDWSAPASAAPSLLASAVPGASLAGASTARSKPAKRHGLHPCHGGTIALAWTGDSPPVVHSSPAPAPAAAPLHAIEELPVNTAADPTARLTPVGPFHTPAFMSGAASRGPTLDGDGLAWPSEASPTPSGSSVFSTTFDTRGPFSVSGPVHPLLLAGAPLCCDVEFIEVQNQRQPLLALCVLERAALRAGIVLRLETCPQEHGASWLTLEGIGRIFVERVDGLVRVNL